MGQQVERSTMSDKSLLCLRKPTCSVTLSVTSGEFQQRLQRPSHSDANRETFCHSWWWLVFVKVQINHAEFCIRNKSGLRVRNKLRVKLSLRMSATAEWFLANGLSLNIDKTCGSIFRSDLNCKSVIKKVIIKKLIVANILVLLEYFDIDLSWQICFQQIG